MTTQAESALAALRRAGFKYADVDFVALFGDPSAPGFIENARRSHPQWFDFDARGATPAALDAGWKDLKTAERQRQRDRAPKPTPGFDARVAPSAEAEAEFRRLTRGV